MFVKNLLCRFYNIDRSSSGHTISRNNVQMILKMVTITRLRVRTFKIMHPRSEESLTYFLLGKIKVSEGWGVGLCLYF